MGDWQVAKLCNLTEAPLRVQIAPAAERDEIPTGLDETLNDPAWSFAGRETASARAAAAGRTTEGLELERMLALNVIGVLAKFRDGRKISREEQAALERDLQTLESRNRPR